MIAFSSYPNIRITWKIIFVIFSLLTLDSKTSSFTSPSSTALALSIRTGFHLSSRSFNSHHGNTLKKTNSSSIHSNPHNTSQRHMSSKYKKWIHHPIGFFAQTKKKLKSIMVMSASTDASSSSSSSLPTSEAFTSSTQSNTSSSTTTTPTTTSTVDSVHLKLQSEAMKSSMRHATETNQAVSNSEKQTLAQTEESMTETENPSNSNTDTSDDKNSNNNQPSSTITLHTYTDKVHNITLQGLNIPKRKFYAWVDYTILQLSSNKQSSDPNSQSIQIPKNHPPKTIQIDQVITEEICMDNNEDMRSHLRKVWRERRLISERTEMLATYASDRMNTKAQDGDSTSNPSSKISNGYKRGGFSDLLYTYADRLVAIVKDEQDDYDLHQQYQLQFKDSQSMSASILNSGALLDYIQTHYGESQTRELLYENLRHKSKEDQFKSLQHFLDWFRNSFPYYYDRCDTCQYSAKENPPPSSTNNDTTNKQIDNDLRNDLQTSIQNDKINEQEEDGDDEEEEDYGAFLGYVYPSEEELRGKATRTELYWCENCGAFTRFPRFNSASWVVHKHRGRCGEYSMLLFRMLRALDLQSRWVIDWADHVWAEVKVGDRWIHADPCEAALDKPLLYQEWGKQQNYIVAFNAPSIGFFNFDRQNQRKKNMDTLPIWNELTPLVQDVTSTYTSDAQEVIQNRRDESLSLIESSISKVEEELKTKLNGLREKRL